MADIRNQADVVLDGEFVISEANGNRSRTKRTIATGEEALLKVGHVAELSGANVQRVATAANAMGVVRAITGSEAKAATATLTLTGLPILDETVVVGGKTYTWKAAPTTVDGEVEIGGDADTSIDNLISAITLGAGSGTVYGSSTVVNANVKAYVGAGDTMIAEALTPGSAGNTIAATETMTNGSWSSATLLGGEGVVPTTAIVMERDCEVVADLLNYNGLSVATVDAALIAVGIIPRSRPLKQTTQTT